MGFKAEIEGLDIFLEELNTERISKQLAFGVAEVTNIFNQAIEASVVGTYSVSATEVNSMLEGKSTSTRQRGKNVIRGGLAYRYKAKPLVSFPFKEFDVAVRSRFKIPRGKGFSQHKRTSSKGVMVAVKRGQFRRVRGKGGFSAYFQHAGTSKWAAIQGGNVKTFRRGIYARLTDQTWIEEPITRAPVEVLFGPSIASMVSRRLDTDKKLTDMLDNFDLLIAEHITL